MIKTSILSSLAFLFTLGGSLAADPTSSIKVAVNDLISILYGEAGSGKSLAKKEALIKTSMSRHFSWEYIIRRAVGRNWSKLSKTQQNKVTELTTDLIIRSYTSKFSGIKSPRVSYFKPKSLGQGRMEVPSKVILGRENYLVHYRVVQISGKWQVYDLVIEGVSMVGNYRKQFDSHFLRGNGDQLVGKLKSKLAQDSR